MKKPIKILKKPKTCEKCGGKVVKILYGEPTLESFKLIEEKKMILGGCNIVLGESPDWECIKCHLQFRKISEPKTL